MLCLWDVNRNPEAYHYHNKNSFGYTNDHGEKTPAHQLRDAASSGNLDELKRLVQRGVYVNDRSSYHNTVLLYASKHGNKDCIRFLIDEGADVNIANDSGYTPLIGAAIIGDYEAVKMLLDAGAETWRSKKSEDDCISPVQHTALDLAERNHHHRVAELLESADGG